MRLHRVDEDYDYHRLQDLNDGLDWLQSFCKLLVPSLKDKAKAKHSDGNCELDESIHRI
jgi:hypothetical protein